LEAEDFDSDKEDNGEDNGDSTRVTEDAEFQLNIDLD
jgi:hypothetical protein